MNVVHSGLVAADVTQDCLLGIDFLGKHGYKIDFDAKSLGIGGKIVNLLAKSGGNKVFAISLAETVVVPGCNEMVLLVLDIKKTRPPDHPQNDGMVDHMNYTIHDMLAKHVAEHQHDWDVHLPMVMMAYQSSVHSFTQYTTHDF